MTTTIHNNAAYAAVPATGASTGTTHRPTLSAQLAQASALSGLTTVSSGSRTSSNSQGSWYEALAAAWGNVLNSQANDISALSNTIGTGENDPASITTLTAKSLEFSFSATSASTSITESGDGLKQLGQK
jgi:hypothetical protein